VINPGRACVGQALAGRAVGATGGLERGRELPSRANDALGLPGSILVRSRVTPSADGKAGYPGVISLRTVVARGHRLGALVLARGAGGAGGQVGRGECSGHAFSACHGLSRSSVLARGALVFVVLLVYEEWEQSEWRRGGLLCRSAF